MASGKRALILVAEGNEDVEVTIPAYIFRYGGLETVIAGIDGDGLVSLDRDIKIKPDMSLEEARKTGPFDVVFLPGGIRGAPNLANSALVGEVLKEQESGNRLVAAICFSPALSLTKFEIYKGKNITCYPKVSMMNRILESKTHTLVEKGLVEDGNVITAMGPAFAIGISLAVVRRLSGEEKANEVSKIMLLDKL
ncbi:Protein deglycase DJ-1 [Armadillidium nasatum]|uniref:Protein deglycase DJ-1 n=1 Tax=Armadillidium nasatum TaxID=96803 RepID=A0A5N5T0D1_9CRUS|nr:Protein deglycase DJ-1 [Armadillidium nasatum]